VGSPFGTTQPENCQIDSLLSRGNFDRASRVHQEDAQGSTGGNRNREAKDDRGSRMKKRNPHIGSSLNDFLKEEGILEDTRTLALKETLAWQIQQAMKKEKINKVEMAKRMHTSRAALDRLLDPDTVSVTLQTLCKAARAIGRDLRIELV
jgi:predicted XRE-type DNA-binding protein